MNLESLWMMNLSFSMNQNDIISNECSTQIIIQSNSCQMHRIQNLRRTVLFVRIQPFISSFRKTKIDEEEPLLNTNIADYIRSAKLVKQQKTLIVFFCFVSLSFA